MWPYILFCLYIYLSLILHVSMIDTFWLYCGIKYLARWGIMNYPELYDVFYREIRVRNGWVGQFLSAKGQFVRVSQIIIPWLAASVLPWN